MRPPQPLAIRVTHWINVPIIIVMAASGLQILVAYPNFGPQGAQYGWMPQNFHIPQVLRIGGWLAGARHVHFACAWLLLANALVYLVYLLASGEFRRRWFWPPRDAGSAVGAALGYLHIREAPRQRGLYNGLQRAAYTGAVVLGVALVGSGLSMWKPVQLHRLAWLFGGYEGARAVHFLSLVALALFIVGHLVMVAIHWRTVPEMITGGKPGAHEGVE